MNFLCENNLPKDLKSKRSVATWQPSHDPLFSYIFNKLNWSMRGSSFKQIIRKYRKLHIRVCFVRLSQIKLQQLFTGKESIVLKFNTAGSCRSLLHSEWKGQFAYRKLLLQRTETFTVHWKAKLCPSNEKWKKLWLLLLKQQKNDLE